MATLRFCDDAGNDRTVAVGPTQPEVLVGRNAECLLRTRNNTVSRLHAKIWWTDGVYRVRDLDSANGTWCDRRRVKETELADGVELTFGAFPVAFSLDPDERAAPAGDGAGGRGTAGYESRALATGTDGLRDAVTLVERPALPDAAPPILVEPDTDASSPPPLVPGTAAFDALLEEVPEAVVAMVDEAPIAPEEPGAAVPDADESLTQADGFATALAAAEARIAELEQALADRDGSIDRLGLQVEELTNCLGAREDEREAAVRQADSEASSAEDARQALAEVQQSLAEAQDQVAALSMERDGLQSERDELSFEREALATRTAERDALVDEARRWDALKATFESERSALQAEVERLRPLAEKAGTEPDEALAARADSMAKELQEAIAEVASLRTANRAYVKRIARLLQGGVKDQAEATGTAVPPVEESPAGPDGAVQRDAFKSSLDRINECVSEMRTALDVLSGLLPEVLDRVAEDDEVVEQLRSALEALVSGNREVKSEVVAARQKVS